MTEMSIIIVDGKYSLIFTKPKSDFNTLDESLMQYC